MHLKYLGTAEIHVKDEVRVDIGRWSEIINAYILTRISDDYIKGTICPGVFVD